MSERRVVVRVDVSATGNLGTVLKQHAVDAQKLKSAVGAPVNISAAGVRPTQAGSMRAAVLPSGAAVATQAMPGSTDDAGIRAQIAAGQERAASRRAMMFIRQQSAQVPVDYRLQAIGAESSLAQIASQRAKLGTAPHMAALQARDTQEEQSAILASETKRFASQFKLADLKSTTGRADEVAVIQAEIKARWANAAAAREESKIRNTVEYGRVGGALATFGGRIEKAGMIASVGFAAMTGAVAAASPAAFQTLTGSIQLAVGELGIAFIPTIVTVSGYFRQLAGIIRRVNDATGGWVGSIVGGTLALGTLGFALSKAGMFLLPLFSFGKWITGFGLAGTGASVGVNSLGAAATRAAIALGLIKPTMNMSLLSSGVGGSGAAAGGGGLLGMLGKLVVPIAIATAVADAIQTVVANPNAAGVAAAGGALGGISGAGIIPAVIGGTAPASLSANFQGQSMGLGEVGQIAQHESIRDQQQQDLFDLQTRGLELQAGLTNALNANTAALVAQQGGIGGAIAAWQVNN